MGHLPPVCMLYGSAWALCYPPRYLNLKNLALDSCFHAACCPAICPDRFSPWTPHSHPPPFLELGEITESVPTPAFLHIPDMKAVVKHAESSPIYFFLPYIPSTLMSGEYLKEKNLTWPTTPECQDKQLPGRRWSAVSRWWTRMCWTRIWDCFLNSRSTSGLTSRTFGCKLPELPTYWGPGSYNPSKEGERTGDALQRAHGPVFPSDPQALSRAQ